MTAASMEHLLPGLMCGTAEKAAEPGDGVWDDRLAARALQGDMESFGELIRRYEGPLYGLCLLLTGVAEEARDAAQETCIRAWHALAHYEMRGRFRAWLWCIAVNLCRDRLRVGNRRRKLLTQWQSPQGDTSGARHEDPDERAHWREEMSKLGRGLEAMPESLRWPLMLCSVDGLPQAECAIVLGVSVRAVEGKVRRARQWLLDWWSRNQ